MQSERHQSFYIHADEQNFEYEILSFIGPFGENFSYFTPNWDYLNFKDFDNFLKATFFFQKQL